MRGSTPRHRAIRRPVIARNGATWQSNFSTITHTKLMSFYDKVYEYVKKVPKGKVVTYGQVACMLGSPRASRAVGYALHFNPTPVVIPCHRVVNKEGRLAPAFAFGGIEAQAALLEQEGVRISNDFTVDLATYQWRGE